MKLCPLCKENKQDTEFYQSTKLNKKGKPNLSTYCKDCSKIVRKRYKRDKKPERSPNGYCPYCGIENPCDCNPDDFPIMDYCCSCGQDIERGILPKVKYYCKYGNYCLECSSRISKRVNKRLKEGDLTRYEENKDLFGRPNHKNINVNK